MKEELSLESLILKNNKEIK